MKFFQKLLASLDNTSNGFSGRKMTAFTITGLTVILHFIYFYAVYKEQTWATAIFGEVLIIDFFAVGFFMGLVTVQNVLDFKNGKPAQ